MKKNEQMKKSEEPFEGANLLGRWIIIILTCTTIGVLLWLYNGIVENRARMGHHTNPHMIFSKD